MREVPLQTSAQLSSHDAPLATIFTCEHRVERLQGYLAHESSKKLKDLKKSHPLRTLQ